MVFTLKANSAAVGAALLMACTATEAQIARYATPSPTTFQTSTAANANGQGRDLDQAAVAEMKKMIKANAAPIKLGVLFAAVPGAVLGVGDAMIETAMGPGARLGQPGGKNVWGRTSISGAKTEVQTGMMAPLGSMTNRLEARTFTAQFGASVYSNDKTRIDATFGLGGRATELSGGKNDPDLKTYSASIGAILGHQAPADINLRLGAQFSGGGSELKGPALGKSSREFKQRFRHYGLGMRGEVSRDFALGSSVVVTPLAGLGVNTAWVKQSQSKVDNHNAVSVWASTRLAYHHTVQSGRNASFWVEPTYIGQLKRTATVNARISNADFSITSRLPRDRMGFRVGMDMPIGKQASLEAGLSRFWGVGNSKQKDGSLHIGYVHRF